MSSRAIERSIRRAGLPINRGEDILPIIRNVQSLEAAGANIKFIGKDKIINTERLPPAITRIRRNYSFRVKIIGTDPSGTKTEKIITYSTDNRNITPRMIEDETLELMNDEQRYGFLEDMTATVEFGMQRA